MKRPFQKIHDSNDDSKEILTSTSMLPPIVIELDDSSASQTENPSKRARVSSPSLNANSSLDLLVKAMERVSRIKAAAKAVVDASDSHIPIVDRVPSLCHEISDSPSTSNVSRVDDNDDGPSPVPIKSIVYYKKPSVPQSLPPVLPKGRPLMAPPRLPTNLRPGQIMIRKNKLESSS